MRRYWLPLSLAFLIFCVFLPGMLLYMVQSWDAGRAVPTYTGSHSQSQGPVQALQSFDDKEALRISQAAVGRQIGDYTFLDRSGRKVRISDYRGKPLVVSLIYTHCPFICATTTRNLTALKLSQSAFGADSFGVLTVGFDTENDTPEAMDDFAKRMGVDLSNWEFASADPETIEKLSKDLGFTFFPTDEGGFNHITQTTFLDAQGRVFRQIYGDEFENKTLLEPLRDMIYNIKTAEPGIAGFANKVKLFCTVYDSTTGKYEVSYNYLYATGLGLLLTFLIGWGIFVEYQRSHKHHSQNRGQPEPKESIS